MKSVLLGGLKVFLTNDGGFPLSAPGGRAKFFKAGTSTPETVYSDINLTPGTALGPVVYTDSLGALPAIWLKTDRLYKVQIEQKLPGTPETWALLWEVDNVGYIDPHESEEPGEAPIAVNSIAALKAVDHSEHTEVMVNGYYAYGDWGTPSMFVWDAESTAAADGGAFIRPNDVEPSDAGRWVQIFDGDIIDVRKFGALPDMTLYADVTAEVVSAVNYSQRNSTRSRPITVGFVAPGRYYFSGNFDFSQYTFTDLSDTSLHPIKWFIGNDVIFVGHDSVFTLSKETICTATEALIEGDAQLLVQGGGGIKVDPAWWGNTACVLEDCYVECHSKTFNDKSFTRCHVTSEGMLGVSGGNTIELHDMDFKESWFVDTFQFNNMESSGLMYDVNDCKSADSYVAIKTSQGDPSYGDLNGGVLSNPTILGDCTLSNCSGSVKINQANKSYRFENVSLTLNGLDTVLTSSIHAIYSNIEIGGGTGGMQSLKMNGGVLSGTSLAVTSAELREVDINCAVTSTNPYGSDILEDCIVRSLMNFVNVSIVGCEVRARIAQKGNLGDIKVRCLHNHFTGNGLHLIYSETANAIVTGEWIGNSCDRTDQHWIAVDRTNLDLVDSHHSYSYIGNEQPYIDRNNGANRVMLLKPYSGTDYTGAGVFSGETNDFIFYDTGSHKVSIVPKAFNQAFWKMFSVGITEVRRSGHIESGLKFYSNVPFVGTWGTAPYFDGGSYEFSYIMGVCLNNVLQEDGTGYDWSFEQPGAVHDGHTGIGPEVGCFTDSPSNIGDTFKVWPEQPTVLWPMYLFVEKDFYSKEGD